MSSLILNNYRNRYSSIDNIFDAFFSSNLAPVNYSRRRTKTVPMANILEGQTGYKINIAAPGLSKGDFNLTIENEILTVSTQESDAEDGRGIKEFNFSSFSRSFALPKNTNYESIAANYEAGILQIDIPTKTKKKPVQIKVG